MRDLSEFSEAAYVVYRILLWIATLLALIFPLLYHYTTNGAWADTPIGRHIMQFRGIVALALLFTAISIFLPVEAVLVIAIILYAGIIAVLVTQIRFVMNPRAMDPDDLLSDEPAPDHATKARHIMNEENPPMKSRPVVITMSILAALQFLFGGLTALNLPDGSYNEVVLTVGAFGTLVVAAAQFGIQFYVQNLVTPQVDVAAYRDTTGQIVAGPAAPPEGEDVTVVNDETGRATR